MYKTEITPISKPNNPFNEQEMEILLMLAYEYNSDQICRESQMSLLDVQSLLFRMYHKLKVHTRVGLIRAAFEHKILILA